MKLLFTKIASIAVIVLGMSTLAKAGGGYTGGGNPLKYVDLINTQENRFVIVDDSSFIDLIGMMGDKNTEFTDKANIDFDGLVLNNGTSYISALRYDDGKNVYMVSQSQYEKIKTETKLNDLIKKLDFDTSLLRLKP